MVFILPKEETVGSKIATGFGEGLGRGLEQFAADKFQTMQRQKNAQEIQSVFGDLLTPQQSYLIAGLKPKDQMEALSGLAAAFQQQGQLEQPGFGGPYAQNAPLSQLAGYQSPQEQQETAKRNKFLQALGQGGGGLGLGGAGTKQAKIQTHIEKGNKAFLDPLNKITSGSQEYINAATELKQLLEQDRVTLETGYQYGKKFSTKALGEDTHRAEALMDVIKKDKNIHTAKPSMLHGKNANLAAVNSYLKAYNDATTKQQIAQQLIQANNGLQPANLESLVNDVMQGKTPSQLAPGQAARGAEPTPDEKDKPDDFIYKLFTNPFAPVKEGVKNPTEAELKQMGLTKGPKEFAEFKKDLEEADVQERGLWKPKSAVGKFVKGTIQDTASMMQGKIPKGTALAPLWQVGGVMREGLWRAAKANALGTTGRVVTGSDYFGDILKAGYYISPLFRAIGQIKPQMNKEASAMLNDAYEEAKDVKLDGNELEKELGILYKDVTGADADFVRARITEITNKINLGEVELSDLMRQRDSINNYYGRTSDPFTRGWLSKANDLVKNRINQYAPTNPKFAAKYEPAYEMKRAIHQHNNVSEMIAENSNLGEAPASKAARFMGISGRGVKEIWQGLVQMKEWKKFLESTPQARKYVDQLAIAAANKDSALFATYLNKLGKILPAPLSLLS